MKKVAKSLNLLSACKSTKQIEDKEHQEKEIQSVKHQQLVKRNYARELPNLWKFGLIRALVRF